MKDNNKILNWIEKINAWITPIGFECIEIETVIHEGILRIYIDQLDSSNEIPVNVEDCAKVSRLLDEKTEFEDFFKNEFRLEVSSPGIERPLRLVKHFAKQIGKTVKVALTEKIENRANGSGILTNVNNETGTISVKTDAGEWSFPAIVIKKARLVHEWG